jgi:hypothetical protein
METTTRTQKKYDHRLKELVRSTQDITCAVRHGVPQSTARGWLNTPATKVISVDVVHLDAISLQQEVLQPRARLQKLIALLRVMLAVLKLSGYSLNHARVPDHVVVNRDAKNQANLSHVLVELFFVVDVCGSWTLAGASIFLSPPLPLLDSCVP